MSDLLQRRARMVNTHLARRGITDRLVLEAFRAVPRESFVPPELAEQAYDDEPLPIGGGQTISQPFIVALTVQALALRGGERVLEIGTGSGYAAAILAKIAAEVHTVERIEELAESARARLARLGYDNVHVHCGDGSLGWRELAPYDAIAVAAAGPEVPKALVAQLAVGGRLVIPVGKDPGSQRLLRITRRTETDFGEESLGGVRFVPLIGAQGWTAAPARPGPAAGSRRAASLAALVREFARPLDRIETAPVDDLLDRIGDARVVLLGEATHGTSEFYRMRARITRELVRRKGFRFVALEADWPDASRVGDHVRGGRRRSRVEFSAFERFPTWMWGNQETQELVGWLRAWNAERPHAAVDVHGLDLYSLFTSIAAVLAYLDEVDPAAARTARGRYAALTPWRADPAAYGRAVLVGRSASSEREVVAMLRDMLERRLEYARKDGDRFFDAAMNARLVTDAERYYRAMYFGHVESWNLRDQHMFDTLRALLAFHGEDSKGVVWAHNSHVGDAMATEIGARGEHNIGALCRTELGRSAFIVGFGTDHGTVAAASDWGEAMEPMAVRPSHASSYERVFHDAGVPAFLLHLREPLRPALRTELESPRLERAIGVVYRPDSELASHYFQATLPHQFDEYVWFDETSAVRPLAIPGAIAGDTAPLTAAR